MATRNSASIMINAKDNTKKSLDDLKKNLTGVQKLSQTFAEKSGAGALLLAKRIAVASAALLSIRKIYLDLKQVYSEGIDLTIRTEKTKTQISALIASAYEFKNELGKDLSGIDKLNQSLTITDNIMNRLRVNAIKSGSSLSELSDVFQKSVTNASGLGISVDKLISLSTLATTVGGVLGLGEGRSADEFNKILSGKVGDSDLLASNLGFQSGGSFEKQYKEAFEKGGEEFSRFIEGRLEQFKNAGDEYSNTLIGVFDQLRDTSSLLKEDISSGLANQLKDLKRTADSIFEDGGFTSKLDGLIAIFQNIGDSIGIYLVEAFEYVVDLVFKLSEYLKENSYLVNLLGSSFVNIVETVKMIWGVISEVAIFIYDILDKLQIIKAVLFIVQNFFTGIRVLVALIADGVKLISDTLRYVVAKSLTLVYSIFIKILEVVDRITGTDFSTNYVNFAKQLEADIIGANNSFNTFNKELSFSDRLAGNLKETFKDIGKQSEVTFGGDSGSFNTFLNNLKKKREEAEGELYSNMKLTPIVNYNRMGNSISKNQNKLFDSMMKNLDRELRSFQDGLKIKQRENNLFYNNYRKTIQDFYKDKEYYERIDYEKQIETYDLQINAVKNQIKKLGKLSEEQGLNERLLDLINKRNNAEAEYNLNIQENVFAREKDFMSFNQTIKKMKASISELLGNTFKSNKISLDIEIENLNYENQNNKEMIPLISNFKKIKEFYLEQSNALDKLSLGEERYDILRRNNSLSTIDYYEKVSELNKNRLKQYQEELDLINKLAPGERDNNKILELNNLILETGYNINLLSKDINENFKSSFESSIESLINGTATLKDAFKSLFDSIFNQLSKLVANNLATSILGDSSGGGGIFGGSLGGLISGIFGARASGGFVDGGKPYLINEHSGGNNKEIFIPNTSGYVMNASRSNDLLGHKKEMNITNVFNITTNDAQSFRDSEHQIISRINKAISKVAIKN